MRWEQYVQLRHIWFRKLNYRGWFLETKLGLTLLVGAGEGIFVGAGEGTSVGFAKEKRKSVFEPT